MLYTPLQTIQVQRGPFSVLVVDPSPPSTITFSNVLDFTNPTKIIYNHLVQFLSHHCLLLCYCTLCGHMSPHDYWICKL
jgi:hypothetical protein